MRPFLIGIILFTSISIGIWYILFSRGLYEPPERAESAVFFENAWIWDALSDTVVVGNHVVSIGDLLDERLLLRNQKRIALFFTGKIKHSNSQYEKPNHYFFHDDIAFEVNSLSKEVDQKQASNDFLHLER